MAAAERQRVATIVHHPSSVKQYGYARQTMQVPSPIFAAIVRFRRPGALLAVLLLAAVPVPAARGPAPEQRIALEPLGYRPPSNNTQLAGDAMVGLHYVDANHLLVTFDARKLMKRLPDARPDDLDHNIVAVLLELPSGREIARTEWRVHDYAPFLWELGGGRFLLRIRDTLTTFAPLAAPGTDAFAQRPFVTSDTSIRYVTVSQDKGVVVLETDEGTTAPAKEPVVHIRMLRVLERNGALVPQFAGDLRNQPLLNIPLTSSGHVLMTSDGPGRWLFDYRSFSGKVTPLAGFETSCNPFPAWVSGSEFVTFGCRGSEINTDLAGFNMKGEEMWQMNFSQGQGFPEFVAAPAAGRFAVSRALSLGVYAPVSIGQIAVEEVRVIQTYNGRLLLRAECSPVQRLADNFALSPDGMSLAVMHDGIEIYRLPPLSAEDQKAIADARAHDPAPEADMTIDLHVHALEQGHASPAPAAKAPAAAPASAPAQLKATPAQPADEPRQPPTLYSPGDSPQP